MKLFNQLGIIWKTFMRAVCCDMGQRPASRRTWLDRALCNKPLYPPLTPQTLSHRLSSSSHEANPHQLYWAFFTKFQFLECHNIMIMIRTLSMSYLNGGCTSLSRDSVPQNVTTQLAVPLSFGSFNEQQNDKLFPLSLFPICKCGGGATIRFAILPPRSMH